MKPRFQAFRLALAASFFLLGLPAHGQMLPVQFQAQAQMTTKAGDVTGCGFSFVAAHVDEWGMQGLSGSINLYLMGAVAVKAGLFDMAPTGNAKAPVKRTPSPFQLSWARAGSGKAVSPQKPEHRIPSEDDGFQLFVVPLEEAGADLLMRVAVGGEKLWLGFRSMEGRERIFSGPLKWEGEGEAQFRDCFDGLSRAASELSVGATR
ncbi:MAG: hypothetical protein ROZ64_03430 [Burkholderiaceae bacterium]|jgi:hypothetical protein|nr:hypothetical protein [Burkholderiaceae bacterium]